MTHDRMCPCSIHTQPHIQHLNGVCHYCQCDLIAKVRADERQRSNIVVNVSRGLTDEQIAQLKRAAAGGSVTAHDCQVPEPVGEFPENYECPVCGWGWTFTKGRYERAYRLEQP